eukprot:COSAG04_NODE_1013_length_8768_cov_10.694544_2_plen_185_part_00
MSPFQKISYSIFQHSLANTTCSSPPASPLAASPPMGGSPDKNLTKIRQSKSGTFRRSSTGSPTKSESLRRGEAPHELRRSNKMGRGGGKGGGDWVICIPLTIAAALFYFFIAWIMSFFCYIMPPFSDYSCRGCSDSSRKKKSPDKNLIIRHATQARAGRQQAAPVRSANPSPPRLGSFGLGADG